MVDFGLVDGDEVRFDEVVISRRRRELTLAGTAQHLEPQAFDLLLYLVDHADRVVPKIELLEEIWGHRFVSEAVLTTRIKEIRRAVGDTGRAQRVIRTVRGHGYRFVADGPSSHREDAGGAAPATGAGRRVGVSELFGRDNDVTLVLDLVERCRLVTLIGPGGVGKTRLAQLVAERSTLPAVPVELGQIDDGREVLPVWRATAGLSSSSVAPDEALAMLAGRPVLYLFDNCEHVVDDVVALLEALPEGPSVVLATSRERLGLAEEQLYRVEPLDRAAARRLFVERARRSRPDLQLSDEHGPAIDALTASVDRLPLAVEMAAGRLAAIGLADLSALVSDAPHRLGTSRRAAVDRHRTVGELIAWSERMLSASEHRLLADLSVFAGPVAIDDVVGVVGRAGDDEGAHLGGEPDRMAVIDDLVSLVERSLVMADTGGEPAGYHLLETTRAHVRQRRRAATDRAHAQWFTEEAERLDQGLLSAEEAAAHHHLARIVPELRRAHRWAIDHDLDLAARQSAALLWWSVTRLHGELAAWSEATHQRLPADHPDRPMVAAHLAADAAHRGDYGEATALATTAATSGDPEARVAGLDTLINVALYLGDLEGCRRWTAELADMVATAGPDSVSGSSAVIVSDTW